MGNKNHQQLSKPHDDFHGDSMSDFNGQNPNGQWRLEITDGIHGDSGTLFNAGETAPWGTAIGTQVGNHCGAGARSICARSGN